MACAMASDIQQDSVDKACRALMPQKKRYEWIDNSRVIASFLIMYVHLPLPVSDTNGIAHNLFVESTYSGRVAMFLMLSGYLFGRNAPWGKTLDRFFWLLVPYLLWNAIILGLHMAVQPMESINIWQILGIGAVFNGSLTFTSAGACSPIFNVPAWYMRDMLPLTLITPLLVRFKQYIWPFLLVFALFPPNELYMNPRVMMAPSTCFFYMVGICLTRFKVEDGYRIFNDKATPIFILTFAAACAASLYASVFHGRPVQITLLGMLIGAMMIAHCGVMIEKHLPGISKKLAPLGPASFLVFMIHYPIFWVFQQIAPSFTASLWVLLLPIPTWVIIVTIFLTMKRYTPWLMPYLGHMKIKKKPAA